MLYGSLRGHNEINEILFSVEDPKNRQALSTLQLIKQLIREEGVATLYRGMIPVLQSLCISNFVYFYTFHSLKALSSSSNQSAVRDLLLGTVSGIVNVSEISVFSVRSFNRNEIFTGADHNAILGGEQSAKDERTEWKS